MALTTTERSDQSSTSNSATAAAHDAGKSPLTGVLQRKGDGGPAASNQDIAAAGFEGPTMPVPYQSQMEQGFGVSFSGVNVHGGGAAAEASSQLGAEAYAVGQNVAFADPNPGPAVVAHELAHTIQQGGGAGPVQTWSEGSSGDSFEQEADSAAATVLAGGTATVSQRTGPTIARWGGEDHYAIGNLAGQKALAATPARPPPDVAAGVTGATGTFTGSGGMTTQGTAPTTEGINVAHRDVNAPLATPTSPNVRTPGAPGTGIATRPGEEALMVNTGAGNISFGAMTRFGGDYASTPAQLREMNSENNVPVTGGERTSFWSRLGAIDLPPGNDFGTLAGIGTTNGNHFYPINRSEYSNHHALALAAARAGEPATAMMEEGFASHFLMDTFSAGHCAPRSLDSIEHLNNADRVGTDVALTMIGSGAMDATQAVVNAPADIAAAAGAGTAAGAESGGNAGEDAGASVASWIGSAMEGLDIGIDGQVVEGYTGVLTRMLGRGVGTVVGGVDGMASGVASGVSSTASAVASGVGTAAEGVAAGANAIRVGVPAFLNDAVNGLVRSKDWHDFFCALPNGLPTDKGRFHGDHLMDGNDLEHVSNVASRSLVEVFTSMNNADGTPGTPVMSNPGAEMPRPDHGAIMADPVAGPAWRMMQTAYQADMTRALAEIQSGSRGRTDGGTEFDSRQAVLDIYANVFGGGVPYDALRAGTLGQERDNVQASIAGLIYYFSATFGANQHMGLHDDIRTPTDPGYGGGRMQDGGELSRFYPVIMRQSGMFNGHRDSCARYLTACQNARATGDVTPQFELAFAQDLHAEATAMASAADALPSLVQSGMQDHGMATDMMGAAGLGLRAMAGFANSHGLADLSGTRVGDPAGDAFKAQWRPAMEHRRTQLTSILGAWHGPATGGPEALPGGT